MKHYRGTIVITSNIKLYKNGVCLMNQETAAVGAESAKRRRLIDS